MGVGGKALIALGHSRLCLGHSICAWTGGRLHAITRVQPPLSLLAASAHTADVPCSGLSPQGTLDSSDIIERGLLR